MRVVTPTLLQMEAVECGAVSLGIILASYGCHMPLGSLREACGVSRDGSKASNILKAARKLGMEAKGYRKEPDSLRGLKPPFIVHWNFNHFLVVEGFSKRKVYLNDPAHGRYAVSEEEFDQSYTGIVITMEPGEGFQRAGRPFSVLESLLGRLKGNWQDFGYLLLTSLALAAVGVMLPIFVKLFVDQVLSAKQKDWLPGLAAGMGVAMLLKLLLAAMRESALLRLETKLSLSMSGAFIWHILRLPVGFFAHRFVGDITGRAASNDKVAAFVTGRLAGTVIDSVLVVSYALVMALYSWQLMAVAVGIALLNVAYLLFVARKRSDENMKLQADQGKFWGASVAGLMNMESLKANGRESDFFARWAGYQANLVTAEQKARVSGQYLSAVPSLLELLNQVLILVIGGLLILKGDFTVGMLLAFQGFATGFLQPVKQLVSMGSELQEMKGALVRLDDVLQHPPDKLLYKESLDSMEEQGEAGKLAGQVTLSSLTFGYSPLEPPLIDGLSLEVRPGTMVAIVGGSGSGKSTLSKLIAGLYEPWSGTVELDGVPRGEHSRQRLADSIALVDQEIRLFEGTVRDNLSLWDRTIPEQVLVASARAACIHDAINSRPGKYDHPVEEGGRNFSGGQAQRLEIARALAQQPSILLLDEATSALDPQVEAAIYANIRRLGCTCIIVAHRLSAIRDCDLIVVVEQGKLVEQGSHDQLIRQGGAYARLFAASEERREVS